jgi:hypothetical protein
MSIRNDQTGRHEDDLWDESRHKDGKVSIVNLIEHLEQIVALPDTFGSNVANAARTAAFLLRKQGLDGKLDLYSEVTYCTPQHAGTNWAEDGDETDMDW